jgi:hypothetical protein
MSALLNTQLKREAFMVFGAWSSVFPGSSQAALHKYVVAEIAAM